MYKILSINETLSYAVPSLPAWRSWRPGKKPSISPDPHSLGQPVFQLITFHPLHRTSQQTPKGPSIQLQRKPWVALSCEDLCSPHVQEGVSHRFTYQHRIYRTWCKVLLCLWALYVPELQIYAGNRSVIRNQLLYQLCARELLGHRHLYYWSLDVLGIGHGFTVAGASCLWDHSFDPYAFAAFHRAESKFLLLILGFELQKEQPAGRGEERTASFRLLCRK